MKYNLLLFILLFFSCSKAPFEPISFGPAPLTTTESATVYGRWQGVDDNRIATINITKVMTVGCNIPNITLGKLNAYLGFSIYLEEGTEYVFQLGRYMSGYYPNFIKVSGSKCWYIVAVAEPLL